MNKELNKIINKLVTYKNVGRIVVYTNARFIPKIKFRLFKTTKGYSDITDYGEALRPLTSLLNLQKRKVLLTP